MMELIRVAGAALIDQRTNASAADATQLVCSLKDPGGHEVQRRPPGPEHSEQERSQLKHEFFSSYFPDGQRATAKPKKQQNKRKESIWELGWRKCLKKEEQFPFIALESAS